ncbi:hypothetical protein FIC94_05925 [Ochrobactrum teleogrylli]|uniref:Myosin-14 n=1 Tax=Ochrobactrum teleogrylli TaxID=2479765 RepID=A0ABY2YAG9_9HYPH|nr:hypothetical protein FIC94_05925 [[Ochrobactrum] teleogrylli]
MIQSALFFLLGVLVTVFVLILLGPSVWRRAFFLARRQVQAELPITLAEIRADKDGLRAEFAVAISKLEQQLKRERQKAAEQAVVLGRQYEELKRIPLLEEGQSAIEKKLAEQDQMLSDARASRQAASEKSEILQAELERMQSHYTALEGLADTLRIEISANEAERGRLSSEMTEMRRDRKEATARYNELSTQLTSAQTELKSEKRRNGDLQQKLEKLISELSDAQEKLERFSRAGAVAHALTDTDQAEIMRQNAALREEMAELAARMVAATAEKEGPDSPIHGILQAAETAAGGKSVKNGKAVSKSLASRIQELPKA